MFVRSARERQQRDKVFSAQVAAAIAISLLTLLGFYVDLHSAVRWPSRHEPLNVVTHQTGHDVVFAASTRTGWFRPAPISPSIRTLLVIDWVDGTALWEIEAETPRPVDIVYGQVPIGFSQTVPATGLPPAIRPGRWYGVTVHATHGTAVGVFQGRLDAAGYPRSMR